LGSSVYGANNSGKPVMLLCKQCHKDNFKNIPGYYDKENKKFIDTYYEPTTPLGASILAMQSSGNGNGLKK
jgi:5-methylcytosine-specific restriction endonuclease McrA